jgi:hypothetical protein
MVNFDPKLLDQTLVALRGGIQEVLFIDIPIRGGGDLPTSQATKIHYLSIIDASQLMKFFKTLIPKEEDIIYKKY